MSAAWQALVVGVSVLALVELYLILVLFRQFGLVYLGRGEARARDGLPLRSRVPKWVARDQWGSERSRDEFLGLPLLLVFVAPGCAPCVKLLPVLSELHARESAVSTVVVSGTDSVANREMAEKHGLQFPVLTQVADDMTTGFRVTATPFAFFIDSGGVIREKGIVNRLDQIQEKLRAIPRVEEVYV